MVKTLVSIAAALALLLAATFFEMRFVDTQFEKFGAAVLSLEEKVRGETASAEDGRAVQTLWEAEKKKLHVVVPHGDIAYIDYWLSEAIGCIETGQYSDAQSKLTVLREICRQIPESYGITFGNIF